MSWCQVADIIQCLFCLLSSQCAVAPKSLCGPSEVALVQWYQHQAGIPVESSRIPEWHHHLLQPDVFDQCQWIWSTCHLRWPENFLHDLRCSAQYLLFLQCEWSLSMWLCCTIFLEIAPFWCMDSYYFPGSGVYCWTSVWSIYQDSGHTHIRWLSVWLSFLPYNYMYLMRFTERELW